jgi:hypothetical protein
MNAVRKPMLVQMMPKEQMSSDTCSFGIVAKDGEHERAIKNTVAQTIGSINFEYDTRGADCVCDECPDCHANGCFASNCGKDGTFAGTVVHPRAYANPSPAPAQQ